MRAVPGLGGQRRDRLISLGRTVGHAECNCNGVYQDPTHRLSLAADWRPGRSVGPGWFNGTPEGGAYSDSLSFPLQVSRLARAVRELVSGELRTTDRLDAEAIRLPLLARS
jgi:hypothetical protein